jgi:Bacterial Ig-like domain (group 3)/IPT/TIG domain
VSAGGTSAAVAADHFTCSSDTISWIVTNTLASGPGSLAQAVQNANKDTGTPSLITFDPTVFATPQTITLTSSMLISNWEPITIQGPTGIAITVSGGNAVREFTIYTAANVTIQNLTIANCNAGSDGGGIYVYGGPPNISSTEPPQSATVTIDHCTISNNMANHGGGIAVARSSVVLVEDSTISGNTAAFQGGGTYQVGDYAYLTLAGCTIMNNSATGVQGAGGGIDVGRGNSAGNLVRVTVTDCTITGNAAYVGGGIDVSAYCLVVSSTITGNSSSAGGGVRCEANAYVNLVNDIIWNNAAPANPNVSLINNTYESIVNYTLVGALGSSYFPSNGVGNFTNVSTTTAVLGPLGDDGGPTLTFAPAGSPPVGAGGSITTTNASISSATATTLTATNGYVFSAASLWQCALITQPTDTTLAVPVNPMIVQQVSPIGYEEFIQIDNEQMQVIGTTITDFGGGTTLTVVRGVNGTTATTHAANGPIYLVSDQRGQVVFRSLSNPIDMGSVQASADITPTLDSNPNIGNTVSLTIPGAFNQTGVTNEAGQAVFNNVNASIAGSYQLIAGGLVESNPFIVSSGTYNPAVTLISPSSGPVGTSVTINGTNLAGATGVFFGSLAATSFTINSTTQITAFAPAGAGLVDVTVTTAMGVSATSSADHFTFTPTVTGLSPNSGPVSGGVIVTITGTDFASATAVTFGSAAATSFTVNSATQITATSPAGTGVVDVTVTTSVGGTSATSSADHFTYAPTVSGLNPNTGPAAGGTSVVIAGTGFSGATAVDFGSTAATSFTVNSDTQITATSPSSAGVVDVRVTTAVGGTSATSSADQFTFLDGTTTTLIDNGPNPSTYGDVVSFTATVSGGSAINGETVFIEDATNSFVVVASPSLSNSTVDFTISDLPVGSHHLIAVYNGDTTHASSNDSGSSTPVIQVVNAAPAPAFVSIDVNGGDVQYHDAFGNGSAEPIAGQNSVVEQIIVTFNEPVTLDPGAFTVVPFSTSTDGLLHSGQVLVNSGPNPNQVAPILNASIQVGDGHQWIITFGNNAATAPNGSGFYVLKDGVYSVNIDHAKVHANSQTMAADVGGPGASAFWALYGDTTFHDISGVDHPGYIGDGYSDASVGNADFQAFKACDNSDSTNYYAPPNYDVRFDANLDGSVANSDFVQFKANYNADWQF